MKINLYLSLCCVFVTITTITLISNVVSAQTNTGIATITPTERLDIGSGNLRIRDINTIAGNPATDKVLTADATGIVKSVLGASLIPATVNLLSSSGNTITSTVNGVPASAPAVNGVSNTISGNTIATTVNGISGTAVNVPNIYTANGTLSGNRTVTQAANTLTFTGTAASMVKITNTAGTAATPVSALQIVDGSQAIGKVLTSDASGNTSWTFSALKAIPGTLPVTTSSFTTYDNTGQGYAILPTNASITLPPGKWMVAFGTTATIAVLTSTFSYVIETDASLWCTLYLSDGAAPGTGAVTADLISSYSGTRGGAGSIGRGMNKTFTSGFQSINNSTSTNKTYYVWGSMTKDGVKAQYGGASGNPSTPTNAYWVNIFDASNWERYFYAIPIQ